MRKRRQPGWPTKLVLLSQHWVISYYEGLVEEVGATGICYLHEREICLETEVSEEEMLDTLFHEVRHAYHHILRMPFDLSSDAAEEHLCHHFALIIIDLFRNNPKMLGLLG